MRRALVITIAIAFFSFNASVSSGQSQAPNSAPSAPPQVYISPACVWISYEHSELEPLARVCESALSMRQTLPNFICDQQTKCSYPVPLLSQTKIVFHEASSLVTAEVTYANGEEHFDNIVIDRHPASSIPPNFGMWSEGEFSPLVLSVLHPKNHPELKLRKDEPGERKEWVFDYRVPKDSNSGWAWHINNKEIVPGYHGSIWVDKATGHMVRMTRVSEASAGEIDASVPYTYVGSETVYSEVAISGLGKFHLPVMSQLVSCERGMNICKRNLLTFKDCRKFAAKSRIITDSP